MIDTIVAQSTPPGVGALAVVRLSGPQAHDLARRLCPDLSSDAGPRVVRFTAMVDPSTGELLDRGLVTLFVGPASYTGEDMAELSCHGGWLSPVLLVDAAIASGARLAEPGEFTRRAVLNGKLDLVQAEAVLDLVEGRSRALRRAALGQLDRGLSERVSDLRSQLIHLEAMLAHHVDFPEEDDAPTSVETVVRQAQRIAETIGALLRTAPQGELLREGALTVLAGRPNAGKSSLFNALLGEDRAIVTDEPGTTRDAIEAVVSLEGYPFRLIDTAGIRESPGRIERLGVEVARRYLDRADIVLFCVESGTESLEGAEEQFLAGLNGTPVVLVRTKADLSRPRAPTGRPEWIDEARAVSVSATTGEGVGDLASLLPSLVYGGLVTADPGMIVLTRRRQTRALAAARAELVGFTEALQAGVPAEVAATHLRPAETALEELLGVISVDDVLDAVFAQFCIGK